MNRVPRKKTVSSPSNNEMVKVKQLQQGQSFEFDSGSEESDAETKDVDEKSHARLLDAIATMDGSKRLTHTLRSVHGQSMSETGLASSVSADSLMTDLMGSLEQSASFSKMKKQLELVFKPGKGAVETPAPKHIKEKIQRTVGYEKTVTDISRWEPVVTANRKAPQLRFPLQRVSERMLDQQIKYTPVTDLQKEMAELDKKARPVFTPKEKKEMAAFSLEEAKLRRAQLLSMRTLIDNKNSKLRWQNKIKSKRYRRAKKKEKEKEAEKELEELAVRDPQALFTKMEESEKKRILERGRLRHAGGKKFAREAKIFAKYDDEKRQHLQQMLEKHQELKQKKKEDVVLSSDSEEEGEEGGGKELWLQPAAWPTPSSEPAVQETGAPAPPPQEEDVQNVEEGDTHTLKKTRESGEENSVKKKKNSSKPAAQETGAPAPPPQEEDDQNVEEGDTPPKKPKIRESGEENGVEKKNNSPEPTSPKTDVTAALPEKDDEKAEEGDNTPQEKGKKRDGSKAKRRKNKKKTNRKTDPEEAGVRPQPRTTDTPPEQRPVARDKVAEALMTIQEAFDDDDVVAQFVEDKQQTVEEEREKDVDTFLPGWGRWAGPGLTDPPVLRKKFVIKATPTPRKDNQIGHVVFTTKENKGIQKHQLTKVPHPYRSLEHMQKVLSTPLTGDKVKPKVVIAKGGKVIPPLEESVLLQGPNKRKAAADIDLSQAKPRPKRKRRR